MTWPAALTTAAQPAAPATSTDFAGQYHPILPVRLLDTRTSKGAHPGPVSGGEIVSLKVTGQDGLPAGGIAAIALNVTVTNPSAASYVALWPGGSYPGTSNVNFGPGDTIADLVVVGLSADGRLSYYNSQGSTNLLLDVEGWYSDATSDAAATGRLRPLMPSRLLDTRTALGNHRGQLGQGETFQLQATGHGNVPATGVLGVVLNLTVTNPTTNSYLAAYPGGESWAQTSTLNFGAGATRCNRVLVKVGPTGAVAIYNSEGAADVIVDVVGWYTSAGNPSPDGGAYTAVTPARLLDTRAAYGGAGPVGPHATLHLQVGGRANVPADAGSVVVNLTETDASAPSFLAVYPGGNVLPFASDLNFGPGRTVANLDVVKLGSDGSIAIYNQVGWAQVIVDVVGYASAAPPAGTLPSAPSISGASGSPGAVALAWQPPTDLGGSSITSYTILSSVDGLVWAVSGDSASAFIGGLDCSRLYSFTLVATNAAGSGPPSAPSLGITPSCPTSNVIGNVPYYRQVYALSCEAAALQMALGHEGIGVNQTQELNDMVVDGRSAYYDASGLRWGDPYTNFVGDPNGSEIWLTGYGTYSSNVARIARGYGGQVLLEGENVSVPTVYEAILQNHPVVAWVAFDWKYHAAGSYLAFDGRRIPYAGSIEHTVTLVGVTADQVLVYNPWNGPQWMAKSTFESAFATYHNMAVVLQ